jgi:large subunit ribosomal protein L19
MSLTAARSKFLAVKRADLPLRWRRKLKNLRRTLARRTISIFSISGLCIKNDFSTPTPEAEAERLKEEAAQAAAAKQAEKDAAQAELDAKAAEVAARHKDA